MFKPLRPGQVWQPKLGPPFGSHNAFRTGAHVAEVRNWRKRVTAWRRRVREVLAAVEERR
jgi:hypothetical protein